MALVHIEGFDTWGSVADAAVNNWTTGTFTSLVAGRNSYGLAMNLSAAADGLGRALASATKYLVGFAYDNAALGAEMTLFSFADTGNVIQAKRLLVNAAGQLQIEGGTAAAGALNTGGVYNYIEYSLEISLGNEIHTVRQDGNVVITYSVATTMADIGMFRIGNVLSGANNVAAGKYDDLYMMNATSGLTAFLGDSRIVVTSADVDVSGGGTPSSGASKFAMLDEIPANGDTDYVTIPVSPAAFDVYQTSASLPTTPSTIHAVEIRTISKKTDAGAASLERNYTDATTTIAKGPTAVLTTYLATDDILETKPDGTAWTNANLNTLKWGVRQV